MLKEKKRGVRIGKSLPPGRKLREAVFLSELSSLPTERGSSASSSMLICVCRGRGGAPTVAAVKRVNFRHIQHERERAIAAKQFGVSAQAACRFYSKKRIDSANGSKTARGAGKLPSLVDTSKK